MTSSSELVPLSGLRQRKDFIPPEKQTPRQLWGSGALSLYFHAAGRDLEEGNWKKDLESIDVLLEAGYEPKEVGPLIRHFNTIVSWICEQDDMQKENYVAAMALVKERKTFPRTPPPKQPPQLAS